MENKSWKENNSLHKITESALHYVNSNKFSEVQAITYLSEALDIDVDDATRLLYESRGENLKSEEEIAAELKILAKNIPIANLPDPDGLVVVPASWREK